MLDFERHAVRRVGVYICAKCRNEEGLLSGFVFALRWACGSDEDKDMEQIQRGKPAKDFWKFRMPCKEGRIYTD
jgi:hypothetical protein